MVVAIDFDGTLCDPTNIAQGHRMGQPTPGAVLFTDRLAQEGHQIVIFTARSVNRPDVYKAVEDWLIHFKIPHHGITNIKQPYFDVMIDNRALHFGGSWAGLLTAVKKFDNIQS